MSELNTRRSRRERKKPKQIYEVFDKRLTGVNGEEIDGANDASDDEEGAEESEEESTGDDDDDEEADARQFVSPKPKPRARPNGVAPQAGPAKRKSAALVRPRKLKPVQEESSGKANRGDDDSEEVDSDAVFFEATKRGNASLPSLMIEWRDRYEESSEDATREILNFVLQACGGEGQCVPTTEKLEKLDMSDLVNYVVEDLVKSSEGYPIASRVKSFKRFQRNFVEFWDAFVTECFESELLFTSTVVHQFVDWCSTLSSAEIRAVRHTSTIAAYAIGNALIVCAQNVSQQLAVVKRQLNADANSASVKKTAPSGKISKKTELLTENKAMYEHRLQQLVQVVNILFTGVVVHRYRDVMPEVRSESATTLGRWISALPDHFFKDNYLKYLGWMLNDKDASVRLCVINVLRSLYENEEFTEKLELFTSRFLPRYLQLCDDVDDSVVQACVRLLIAVDKRSLINSDIDLQSVEKLVFEPDNAEIRKAAAEFVCLQYDAFGVAESKQNAKLKRDQLNTQAIALVEFAEEYIYNHNAPPECVETVVEAFWGLDDCQVLQDWRLLTDLLLADKSAPDLTTNQQTILIRLLVAAVRKLTMEDSKKKAATDREEMTVAFCKEIPSLLVRYQSDAEKLSLMVELIPMLSLSADIIGPHLGHVKGLLEKLKHAYMTNSEEKLLMALSLAIHHLFQTEHEVVKRETEVTIHEIAQDVIEQVQQSLEDDAKLLENDQEDGTSTLSKRKSKSKANDLSDVEFALRVSLCRLMCLIRYVNVREYLPSELVSAPASKSSRKRDDGSNEDKQVDLMEKLVSGLIALVHRRSRNIPQLREELRHADTIKHTLMVLYLDLLWLTSPVFKDVEAQNKRKLEEKGSAADEDMVTPEEFASQSVREQIESIRRARASLEDCFVSVLEMHLEKTQRSEGQKGEDDEAGESQPTEMEEIVFESEEITAYVKESQRIAFLAFCDTRCLFVEKFEDATPPYDALHWPLPRILVLLTQMYFENEMEAIDDEEPELENTADEPNPVLEEQQVRKAELLVALGRVSISNPSNRRQSAAVLRYFTENAKQSVDVVKAFSKHVKNETPVRYLEVQMTALRQQFNSILALKEELAVVTSSNNKEDDEARQEIQESIEHSEAQLKDLAKKLSQSLGVGKISTSLRAPFFRFLCEGVRYSLEKREHFAFLDPVRPYLGHLDPSSMKQLRTYFQQLLEEVRDEVPADSEDQLGHDWRVVFDFQSAIASKRKKERPIPGIVPVSAAATEDETQAAAPSTEKQNENDEDVPRLVLIPKKRKRSSLQMQADNVGSDADEKDERDSAIQEQEVALEEVEVNAASGEYASATRDRNGLKSDSPKSSQQSVGTPVKRQRRSKETTEHQSNDHKSIPAANSSENEDENGEGKSERTPSTKTGESGKKRSAADGSEPRRTRLKRKQARHQEEEEDDDDEGRGVVESNHASEGAAEGPAGDNTGEALPSVQPHDGDEIDSRRARRRRRSLLLGQL